MWLWADEPCPLYDTVEVQVAATDVAATPYTNACIAAAPGAAADVVAEPPVAIGANIAAAELGETPPLYSDPSPLQARVDFPKFTPQEIKWLRSPPPIPRCHQGSRGTVGGVHTPVALAGPACPLAISRRARVER